MKTRYDSALDAEVLVCVGVCVLVCLCSETSHHRQLIRNSALLGFMLTMVFLQFRSD